MFGFFGSPDSINVTIPATPKARKTIKHANPCQIAPLKKKPKAKMNMNIATSRNVTVVIMVPSFITKKNSTPRGGILQMKGGYYGENRSQLFKAQGENCSLQEQYPFWIFYFFFALLKIIKYLKTASILLDQK